MKNSRIKNGIMRIVQGIIIGAGAILPGISGGVLAVVFGIYRPAMELLTHPRRALQRYWRMLLAVGIGWAIGFLGGGSVILALFHQSETVATCLFIGLILGTLPDLWREAGTQGRGNVRMIESLVNCGAMDGFGHPRSRMAAAAESAVQTVAGMNNGVIAGQMGLFDAVGGTDELFRIDYPDLPEYPAMQKLAYEQELVGVYLSGHPLDGYRSALRRAGVVSTQTLAERLSAGEWSEKQTVTVGGILKSRRQKITKKNEIMAFCVLEDLQGECELIVFPSALEKLSPLLSEGAVLLVTGTAQLREAVSEDGEDELKLLVRTARRAEPDGTAAEAEKPARTRAGVYLKITADCAPIRAAARFSCIMRRTKSSSPQSSFGSPRRMDCSRGCASCWAARTWPSARGKERKRIVGC